MFERTELGSTAVRMYIANADGSGVREAFPGRTDIVQYAWAPDSERAVLVATVAGKGVVSIFNLGTGADTPLNLDLDVASALWRPNHDQLVLTTSSGDNRRFWVVDSDGTDQREIPVSPYAINGAAVSPDGTRLAYATWDPSRPGGINVVDIDAGGDHSISAVFEDGYVWQDAEFSPDNSKMLSHRFLAGTYQSQLGLLDADAVAPPIMMGPVAENPPANWAFAPDGTMILAYYETLSETWIFDSDGGNGRRAPFNGVEGMGWQRQAP
jgi:dipeptidyl aminopeptidase/acylaminoacyl peptidase